ncbi:PEP/pyruvate-binding domain-containing protein [Alkalilimnicola ehrlichii MLHE-1]|uniref:Phosphoenolpyruvate synthase n=1 Tax=Alkalilimnicola ehrlichii (strain ATCC BAA-1101 / DSM 17681 / MLHE-1) TaxID=187272 RepID=Q0A6S3_ALKEH|nr:PEP/pyruvate-binding domain-containing protein [Alkalilimnicola ehrlichii]ABI57464.1 phosphoenolpyruvate synthase [Alkalilimnicola ehrlichii MLHE-1]
MTTHYEDRVVSTGIDGLDQVLDGLRIGDNVVWRVDDLDDYRRFVRPFVDAAQAQGRSIIYLRYGQHAPLLSPDEGIRIVSLDALGGFEAFTRQVYQLITDHGHGAFYVCDCLSDLLNAWATDYMVGNFFQVICPYLYELDTVAYFALLPHSHSHGTLARIRETTQVLIDVRRADNEMQVQPVKVWQRHSPTMFLPHRQRGERFLPVVDSSDATRLQAQLEQRHQQLSQQRLLDYWDRLFLRASQVLSEDHNTTAREAVRDQILNVLICREPRMQALARRYLNLEDLLGIRARMIGSGYIGGKAVGMLLARRILLEHAPGTWAEHLEPHDSYHLGSDVYYAYIVHNGWWPRLMRQRTDAGYFEEGRALHQAMLQGRMPPEVRQELERMLDHYGQYPILVRSSSLMEDGFGNAFAGKYESIFCVNQGDPEERLARLEDAIRQVYASTMSEDALVYRRQRGLSHQEEPMALLLQRVNGRYHDHLYLPDAAGVGVSRNTFVWDADMDPAAGMLRLVMGLGTRAVDRIEGDHACVVALDQPHKRPYRNRDDVYRFSQHLVDVLDINDNEHQSVPLRDLVAQARSLPLARLGEQDREATRRARSLGHDSPVWRLTFDPLLRDKAFVPLAQDLLQTLEAAYEHPVDVEFTVHLDAQGSPSFNIVQCRPLATLGANQDPVRLPARVAPERLFFATRGHFMGGNIDLRIARIIHVDGPRYAALSTSQKYAVARLVGSLNRAMADRIACPVMLIGPGRWGTSSPELGVPVRFADISKVAVLVEVAELGAGMVPDLSFGSHFFQDLVESEIAYVALFPGERDSDYQPDWLERLPGHCRLPLDAAPSDVETVEDPAVAAVVSHFQVNDQGLRVVADVVRQRLFCFQPEETA